MKRLTLIRHAAAEPPNPGDSDFDRRLTPQGHEDAQRCAERMAAELPCPDLFVSSPAPRAVATAGHLLRAFDRPDDQLRTDERLYPGDVPDWIEVVCGLPADCGHVLLCGHNPGISLFAAELLRGSERPVLATAGWLHFLFDADRWTDLIGSGRIAARGAPRE